MIRSSLLLFSLISSVVSAAPPAKLKFTQLGKPDAPVTGTLNRYLNAESDSYSPISSTEANSRRVYEYVVEGLLYQNPDTLKYEPQLAEAYEVSKDSLTFTFHLRKNAKWSDGQPVTAEDVKFSVESVRDPAFKAAHRIPFYEDLETIEILDPATVRFKMKKKYFQNLDVLGTYGFTPILPKHIYGDPKKKFEGAPIFGSGPYKVESYDRGKNIILVRNPNWWAKDLPDQKAKGKFERINFRFIKEENLALEMVKKGQLDHMWPILAENFEKKAIGEPFGTSIKKIEMENKIPKRWGFIGWNFKNPLFQDKSVRLALSHLLNRELLIEKFQFGKAVQGRSYWYYKSPFISPDIKPIEFNPDKAKKLLSAAGWLDKDKKGVLQKEINGKPMEFRFTLLLPNRDAEKYFTIYKEDLKKAGIDMEIKLIEWSSFSKLLDEQKFDAVTMAWSGGGVESDPKQIWHTDSARGGGSNFISYSNKEVDKLIDQAREEMDIKKRTVFWRKISKLIADDAPYTFLFNLKYDQFLVHKRVAYDKPTYMYDYSYHFWHLAEK